MPGGVSGAHQQALTHLTDLLNMLGDVDVNAGSVVDRGRTSDDIGKEILTRWIEVPDCKPTCSERSKSPVSHI